MSSSVQHFAASSQVHDRRVTSRILPKSLIYVACGESNGGMVLNVSDDGLAVSMAIAVGDESYSHLHVRMNGLPQSIEAHGRMVWTTKSKKRAGIQLIDISDPQRQQIREWIAFEGVRDVNLLPRVVADEVASSREGAEEIVSPLTSSEPRSTLLDAFGGTAPETLGPPLPELFAAQGDITPPEPSRSQGFDDVRTAGFRENEGDLASVTMVPKKKSKPEGLSALALILLWIAIPSFGIGLLVGRRPLQQWLSRAEAAEKSSARTAPSLTPPPAPDISAASNQTAVKFSPELPSNLPINTEPLSYQPAFAGASPAVSGALIDAKLLNSMSTQEARAYKNTKAPSAPSILSENKTGLDSKPRIAASGSAELQSAAPKAATVQLSATVASVSSNPAPANSVAPSEAPTSTKTQNNNASPMSAAPNSSATMSSSGTPPSAPPSGASRDANSTTVRQNSSVATTATPPVRVPPPTVPAASSPNFDAHRNPVPIANNSSPTFSASNAAPSAAPPSAPLNSAVSESMAPSAAPKLAPVSVQPPLHGVMTIARSTDQQFILKLPAEALPGGPATSLRMQRFVMVPQQGRWHHHRAIAKLTVGELLSHTAPDKPDAKIQPRAGDTVTVRAFVDKNGAVRELKPVSGRFALMPHVMRTVRDWQFDQTLVDGKPVESEVNITVEYRGAN